MLQVNRWLHNKAQQSFEVENGLFSLFGCALRPPGCYPALITTTIELIPVCYKRNLEGSKRSLKIIVN